MAETLTVQSAGNTMGLYEVEPEGTARGAVIVIQEAFGCTDHIQDICGRLAAEGYRAAAPHLFHRTGSPTIAYDKMEEVMPHLMELSVEGLEADLDATIGHFSDAGFEANQIAIIGFCMGGSVVFLAAARRALGAAVTFYGGGVSKGRFGMPPLLELAPELKTPWLGLFGDQDQSIPVDEVEALREAVAKASVPAEIVRFAEAEHGFHCDERDSYHEASAKDAWQRTLQWIDSHLSGA